MNSLPQTLGMAANSFGSRFIMTSFGESHGPSMGVVIDGCPAGIDFDLPFLKSELEKRRPGNQLGASAELTSKRQESDEPEVLSGIFEGKTLGTPIAIIVRNRDAQSKDYEDIKKNPRAGHSDDVWNKKFGVSDYRGGGRSSGRETINRVIAGAVAKMVLRKIEPKFKIVSFLSQIGSHKLSEKEFFRAQVGDLEIEKFVGRFPSENQQQQLKESLLLAQENGESFGGTAHLVIHHCPESLGQPIFHKLKADFCAALFSIGAVTAVELGAGFSAASALGTEFHREGKQVYGGIRGGISTGEEIILRVSFKPTSSILDIAKKGRHDPCIGIRAVPVFEAMIAIVMLDHILWKTTDKIENFNRFV